MTPTVAKLRRLEMITFCAAVLFVIAGLALYWLVDDSPFIPLMRLHGEFSLSWDVIAGGSAIFALALAAGALPIGWAVLRRAWLKSRRDLWLLAVPLIAFVLVALPPALAIFHALLNPSTPQSPPFTVSGWIALGYTALFVLAALASVASVCIVVARTEQDEVTFKAKGIEITVRPYEFAILPAGVVAVAMVLMLAGTVAWGLIAGRYAPGDFSANLPFLAAIAAAMLLSTAIAAGAVIAGLRIARQS